MPKFTPRMDLDLACRMQKHNGKLWEDVVQEDRPYVEWLVSGDGPKLWEVLYDYLMELLEEEF